MDRAVLLVDRTGLHSQPCLDARIDRFYTVTRHIYVEKTLVYWWRTISPSGKQASNVETRDSASEQANSHEEPVGPLVDRPGHGVEKSRAHVDDVGADGGRCISRVERVSDGWPRASCDGADTSAVVLGGRADMDGIDSK